MNTRHRDIIRSSSSPLQPQPTDIQPALRWLAGTEAILFDVYGTMIISASGDVGAAQGNPRSEAFGQALAALEPTLPVVDSQRGESLLRASIQQAHQTARLAGVVYPEVEIVAIWRTTLDGLVAAGDLPATEVTRLDLERLAIEYETRTNPTWPMPGIMACLAALCQRELQLGIVSNAQFYTRELFPALLGQTVEEIGFDPELEFYSYQYGQAKPGRFLYQQAADVLQRRGVSADKVVFIGNDMLNDILPASQVGFRTVLFAGDVRSLRLREDDSRVERVCPDVVITAWDQLPSCFHIPTRSQKGSC